MAGERSWDEVNAGVRKKLRIAQPLEIVTEKEVVHWHWIFQAIRLKEIKMNGEQFGMNAFPIPSQKQVGASCRWCVI
jgi:hypothetical protein